MMNPYLVNPLARRMFAQPSEGPAPGKDLNVTRSNEMPASSLSNEDLQKEVSWSETDVLQSYLPFANNPDPIVRSKGLKIYKEMAQDDQIKVCTDIRIQARLSTPWEIVPGIAGNKQSEEMADFIKECLTRMRGNFETDMEQIYSAISYGFSLAEKVFEYIERGRFKGKIGLKAIKVREPYNYDFKVDAHGNMLGLIYVGMTGRDQDNPQTIGTSKDGYSNPNLILSGSLNSLNAIVPDLTKPEGSRWQMGTIQNPFPPQKFIIYSYNTQFGNWYGRSDYLAAFPWWLMKKHGRKFWAIWLERYASPFLTATYKRDAGLKAESLKAVDDFIRNMQARNGIRLSDAWTLTPIQFSGSNRDNYEKAIEAYNTYIAHALLFPNLLGFSGQQGSKGGSFGLGKKQFDTFLWVLEKMGRDMAETIVGEQIIKQLIEINYGDDIDQDMLPIFRFVSIDEDAIDVRSQIIQRLAQAGFVTQEEDWVRDFLSLPKKDPDIILPPSMLETAAKAAENPAPIPGQAVPGKKSAEPSKPAPSGKTQSGKVSKGPDTESKMSEFKQREPDDFEKKVKVKQFKEQLARIDDGLFNDAAKAIEKMRDELLSKVSKKRLVSNEDPRQVAKLQINAKALNDVFAAWLVKIFLDTKLGLLEELARAGMNVEIVKKFADSGYQDWNPLPPSEAIDFFARKVIAKIVIENGAKKLIDFATSADITFLKNRAFTIAGVMRDDILNDAKNIILNGIKRVDEAGTVKDLKDMFNKYLDQGVAVDGNLLTAHRLNTIVRTNVTEALNEGRASMIEDPDIKGFVNFWEYSAIIDDRTTDYCLCMDGRIYRVEDMNDLKPPAHFNCRSFIVPITELEVKKRADAGDGVEVDEPCPGRMTGFAELKREPLQIREPLIKPDIPAVLPPVEKVSIDAPAAAKAQADIDAMEKLKKELAQLIVRCPYELCQSVRINFVKRMMNIGEYACEECLLPFRVSSGGDLYLYDPGIDKWERRSLGAMPKFFKKKDK